MAREFEVKYRLTETARDAIARKFGPMDTIVMETVYYDTPSGALSARKWMLRRRLENGHSLCTLKTPGENGGRGEWEVAEWDIRQALPRLAALGAPEELLLLADQIGVARIHPKKLFDTIQLAFQSLGRSIYFFSEPLYNGAILQERGQLYEKKAERKSEICP